MILFCTRLICDNSAIVGVFYLFSIEYESLYDYLSVHHQLDEALASRYVLKIMEGLQYLHDSRVIHANLSVSY